MPRDNRFHLFVCGKTSLACGLETAVDSRKFVRRGVIFAPFEPRVDFRGKLSKLLLGFLRPGFRALHRFFEELYGHITSL